jgi:hypothetical protein
VNSRRPTLRCTGLRAAPCRVASALPFRCGSKPVSWERYAAGLQMHGTFELLVGIAFAVIGALGVVWSVWELGRSIRSSRWLRTEGVVLVSDLQRSRDSDGGYMYRPEISYSYQVDGADFVASRRKFGSRISLSWSVPAARAVRKYPAGSRVSVWYDPTDPQEAVLETGITTLVWISLAASALFLSLGIGALAAA